VKNESKKTWKEEKKKREEKIKPLKLTKSLMTKEFEV
jgi:hypothetical protein